MIQLPLINHLPFTYLPDVNTKEYSLYTHILPSSLPHEKIISSIIINNKPLFA